MSRSGTSTPTRVTLPLDVIHRSPHTLKSIKINKDVDTEGPLRHVTIGPLPNGKLAFSYLGGIDHPLGGVFVQLVHDKNVTDIKSGTRLLALNSHGLISLSKAEVHALFESVNGEVVSLAVQDVDAAHWQRIQNEIVKTMMAFDDKHYIRSLKIVPGSNESHLPTITGHIAHVHLSKATPAARLGLSITGGCDHELGGVYITALDAAALGEAAQHCKVCVCSSTC